MRPLVAIVTAVLTLSLASPVRAQTVIVTDRTGQQTRVFAGMLSGTAGAGWGAAIGAAFPKHTVIYGTDSCSAARVTPLLGPGRIGAAFSKTF